ncbi:bacteriorhodopsin [Rivularia sp. PCC 7116]|uniref:bacteriorhodopsin n=1 Tax=Rivularia sp. PCC 7116 TaxID=373994 RepID=UPI0002EF957F
MYLTTGEVFNDAYRYADWILTVPLLLTETVAVLALSKEVAKPLLIKLVVASVLMIATGYPGEVSDSVTARVIWGTISTIPFAYILYLLWIELGKSLERQLLRNTFGRC